METWKKSITLLCLRGQPSNVKQVVSPCNASGKHSYAFAIFCVRLPVFSCQKRYFYSGLAEGLEGFLEAFLPGFRFVGLRHLQDLRHSKTWFSVFEAALLKDAEAK